MPPSVSLNGQPSSPREHDLVRVVEALDRDDPLAAVRLRLVHAGVLEVDHEDREPLWRRLDAKAGALLVVRSTARRGEHDERDRDGEEHSKRDEPRA